MNNITIAQLETFFWTVELGSVHRAAAKLNLAQPTISLRLRQLEAEVGIQLLARSGRGLHITREGNAFLTHAKLVLDAYRQMWTASAPLNNRKHSHLAWCSTSGPEFSRRELSRSKW